MPDHGAHETGENEVVNLDPQPADPVRRARSISSVDEAAALYRDWASTYDDDVFGTLAFTGSRRIAELLAESLADRTQPVIDLGCGTGAVGRRLAQLGVSTVDGVDLSPEMLAVAAATGAYRNLSVADLNSALDPALRGYAASVSAGTFTSGHVGASVVPELLRMLRQDALVAWVIGSSMWSDFERVLAASPLEVLHQRLEPIRRDGPPEAVMYVARHRAPVA
jgi:SAM-dependent methyltransferase